MNKKIFFASDFHLGMGTPEESRIREQRILRWLDEIESEAEALYLLGDLFDYWFEYKRVVPRGYVRFLGKLAQMVDHGIPVHIFSGNHDVWMFDYLEQELGATVHHKPITLTLRDKLFLLGHGDGLGPGDHGYKFIKKIFRAPINQWLFARLHPNLALWIMKKFSKTSRDAQDEEGFLGADKEWLVQYAERKITERPYDYLLFGHRHLPIDHLLSNKTSRYLNCGDWIHHNTYVVFDGNQLELKKYEG